MIVITRDELVSLEACHFELSWFDSHVPSGRVEFSDRTAFLLWAAPRKGRLFIEWYERCSNTHRAPSASYVDANLAGANLVKADLRGANLTHATCSRANLRGADLSGVTARYAYFIDAILADADLRRADLSGAKLERCTLQGADLRGANLDYTISAEANLHGALRFPTDPPIDGWGTYTDGDVTRLRRTV